MHRNESLTSISTIVDAFLEKGVDQGASDIHFVPTHEHTLTLFRIDGIMHEIERQSKSMHETIISRIKILANLDISEKRLPQDGGFSLTYNERYLNFRVSTFPTFYGESAVVRILDHTKFLSVIEELGMLTRQVVQFQNLIQQPYGLILVTGPTGAGKTTTLFTAINQLNTPEKIIVTLEDPIEYQLEGIRQTQINPQIGLTFANGLRSLFRQNPDIILVGEVRDAETAHIAIRAGISGHLVFSTFHTFDTFGSIVRLIEMDMERFLIATALKGTITQRLVRKICPNCKREYQPPQTLLEEMDLVKENLRYMKGEGCSLCSHTGYKGRTALFEILSINTKLSELILRRASYDKLKRAIIEQEDYISLRDSALSKLNEGITTIDEIYRVLMIKD